MRGSSNHASLATIVPARASTEPTAITGLCPPSFMDGDWGSGLA